MTDKLMAPDKPTFDERKYWLLGYFDAFTEFAALYRGLGEVVDGGLLGDPFEARCRVVREWLAQKEPALRAELDALKRSAPPPADVTLN